MDKYETACVLLGELTAEIFQHVRYETLTGQPIAPKLAQLMRNARDFLVAEDFPGLDRSKKAE